MVALKAQVTIPYFSAIPTDVAVNVWSFEIADDTTPNFEQIGAFLNTFYSALVSYMSPLLDTENATVKGYVRTDAEPQTPRLSGPLVLGASGTGDPLPEEVAVCLSFKGSLTSGQVPARRRGRIFLGPLRGPVVQVGASSRAEVANGFAEDIEDAVTAANAELTTAGNFHTIWSQTNEENVTVTDYWVDNAFDTQRKRGRAPTSRRAWSL